MAGFPRRRVQAFFTRVRLGLRHLTANPPIRRIVVLFKIASWLPGRKPRLPIRPIIRTKVFGHATGRPPIRRIVVLGRIAAWLLARKPRLSLRTTIRTRVFGYITRKPPIQAISTALVGLARAQRLRIRASARFIKRFGYITQTPPIRAIRTLLFASKARALRLRIRGSARFIHVVRTFGAAVVAVFPRKIGVVLTHARARRPPRAVSFARVFGRPTRRPAARPVMTVGFAAMAMAQRTRVRGHAFLRRAAKAAVAAIPNLHRLTIDVATGRLSWIVTGGGSRSPIPVVEL